VQQEKRESKSLIRKKEGKKSKPTAFLTRKYKEITNLYSIRFWIVASYVLLHFLLLPRSRDRDAVLKMAVLLFHRFHHSTVLNFVVVMRMPFRCAAVLVDDVAVSRVVLDLLLMLLVSVAFLQIHVVEEASEQKEIGEVDTGRTIQVLEGLLTKFALDLRTIGLHGDEATDDHLRQLHARHRHGDPFRETPAARTQRVVRVHEGVHVKIHPNEPTSTGRVILVGVPGVDQDGDMMIPMQEDQRSLT